MPSLILLKSPEGVSLNQKIPLNGDVFVIGRDANECQIVIPHHAVSRKHARIVRDGGQFFIEDLQTRGGTYVNSTQIPRLGRQALKHDDRIKICDFHFKFHAERVVQPEQVSDWISKDGKEEEIESAREAQREYIPQSPPDVPGYEFGSYYSTAKDVGDYYDFIALPGGRVAVVIGDVAGRGIAGALLVTKLGFETRWCLETEPNLPRAISMLDERLVRGGLGERFVTLAVAVLDPVAHTITIVCAGQPSPKLYRAATGELVDAMSFNAIGGPLGWSPDYAFEQVTLSLEVGDTVVMFTDGVTDELNPAEEPLGSEPIDRVIALGGGAKQIGERLAETILQHCNGGAQNDDIAIVCFGRAERTT